MRPLRKILLIEDDPDVQAVASLSLEALGGYTVRVASDGCSGLELLDEFGPDLLLLDVMMPDIDGPGVLSRVREMSRHRDLPIVFLTAKAQVHEVDGYLRLGALAVISKPFDAMALSSTIAAIWEERALVDARASLPQPSPHVAAPI